MYVPLKRVRGDPAVKTGSVVIIAATMASAITTDPALTAGLPRTLFRGLYMSTDTGGAGYDVAADGRFLMVQPVEAPQPATSINLVLNWFDELKRTAPASRD